MQLLEILTVCLKMEKKFLEIQEERSMDSEIPYGGMTEWKLQKGFGNEKKE